MSPPTVAHIPLLEMGKYILDVAHDNTRPNVGELSGFTSLELTVDLSAGNFRSRPNVDELSGLLDSGADCVDLSAGMDRSRPNGGEFSGLIYSFLINI